jgi:glycosyltransferase involved in cell wall biosynthesis
VRIALLMPIASPWARQVALRLAELGHSVHIVDFEQYSTSAGYLHNRDPFQAENIAALRAAVVGTHLIRSRFRGGLRYITCARQLAQVCRDCRAQVLLALYGGGLATMAYLSGVRPYAVYAVGSDVMMAERMRRWLSARSLVKAALVLANGGYLSEQTRRMAPGANVVPLLIGVDTLRFAPQPVPPPPVRILCTRGFMSLYNNEGLIHALAALPDQDQDFRVIFASAGGLLEEVRSLADEHLAPPLRRKVTFLGGVTDEEMLAQLQNAHVYVSLSRSDGTSISLLEALACGLFPVLSDIPPNREWVDPAVENGLLVPLDQPKAWAEALERAMTDAELRARAAVFNRQLILQRADARKNMAVLAEKVQGLATPSPPASGDARC